MALHSAGDRPAQPDSSFHTSPRSFAPEYFKGLRRQRRAAVRLVMDVLQASIARVREVGVGGRLTIRIGEALEARRGPVVREREGPDRIHLGRDPAERVERARAGHAVQRAAGDAAEHVVGGRGSESVIFCKLITIDIQAGAQLRDPTQGGLFQIKARALVITKNGACQLDLCFTG